MDMNSIIRGVFPVVAANETGVGDNGSTTNIMDSKVIEKILPLLGLRAISPMYSFIGSWLGIEASSLLTVVAGLWALNKLARQLYHFIEGFISEHFMSSIDISSNDEIYQHLMKWLAAQPRMVNSRALTAETNSKTAWEDEDASNVARDQSGVYLNFSNQEARAPPRYVPALGLHSFWWKGQYYRLQRKRHSIWDDGSSGGISTFMDKEDIVVSCFWRNPDSIKQLLAHAKEQYFSNHQARTMVKRPSPQQLRRYGGRHNWQQVADRPVRDIRTVVLDQHQKLQVLADMNEYLHPETPQWYANRGIPLRRGYLFHGPPGTGKTSLSFALAGIFGLDIHVISLLEPTLTEEDLSTLFATLPRRCVVLLEGKNNRQLTKCCEIPLNTTQQLLTCATDIDTAGLRRPAEELDKKAKASSEGDNNNSSSSSSNNKNGTVNDWKVSDLAKALKKEGDDQKKGISLSGLLNAIDGVASHEGRVLIMTTNVPESLDDALIRPGRVDLQVQFTNATQEQAQELFVRMYDSDQGRPRSSGKPAVLASAEKKKAQHHRHHHDHHHQQQKKPSSEEPGDKKEEEKTNGASMGPETSSAIKSGDLDISIEELPAVAARFAAKIPDGEFSPAQIQGYLLKRKKHPLKAVEEADKWVEGLIRQKAMKTKIMQVQ
ncbi:BCS1 N terminal-domain-containing protein [Whalleya microplaca]|nr:BCS1 N terminal-domain-containing protein [Whalleya microplaca]